MDYLNLDLRRAGLLSLSLLVTACASDGGIAPTASPVAPETLDAGAELRAAAKASAAWPDRDWWTHYGDPQLDRLIAQALDGNPDIAEAAARLRSAAAGRDAAIAKTGTGYGIEGNAQRMRYSENGLVPEPTAGRFFWNSEITGTVERDLDLWDAEEHAVAGARLRLQAEACRYAGARLALASAIVDQYTALALDLATLTAIDAQRSDLQRAIDITRQRYDAGIATEFELERMRGELPDLDVQRNQVDLDARSRRHAIAALLGQGPGATDDLQTPTLAPAAAPSLPADLPLALLARRPDIAASRLAIAAAGEDVEVAHTRFYPNINLKAFAGLSAFGLDQLFKASSLQAGAGPVVSLPIFSGSGLRAGLAADSAAYDSAVARYDATLTGALREVADALSQSEALAQDQHSREQGLASAQRTADLALQRYQAGLSTQLELLDAQRTLRNARIELTAVAYHRIAAATALTAALGGGWQPQDPASDPLAALDAASATPENPS